MRAVLKREFRAYFQSPLGYVFIAVMYFFTGYYFFTYNLYSNTTDMSNLFHQLFSVVLFLVPILTMRLMSEDKRAKTDQLLLTAPVPRIGIVMGKYLSALCVYLIAVSSALLMAVILSVYGQPDWPVIIGNLIGLILLGAALIAICMFLSSLTESQVIAAVCGFAVSLFLVLVDALVYVVSGSLFKKLFSYLSFNDRYSGFTIGLIDFSNVLFFLSVAALFVLLTTAVLEKRRWS
ncbi:MAG: ABC transporter permease subunit [Oscillospiraceae bacterium]|nr:ABC transporter permease subunit [Oscillospiraceae bacterium]